MNKGFRFAFIVLLTVLLTILTQVGGVLLLFSVFLCRKLSRKRQFFSMLPIRVLVFLLIYLAATFIVVPFVARPFHRVPLPLNAPHLQPLRLYTCLLNRHYVRPELRDASIKVSEQMAAAYPGTVTHYLDGCFPFINKFPLIPHLSHNDGKKLDLSFFYTSAKGEAVNECPSPIGYGICEEPRGDEQNTAVFCAENGYWQYSLLKKLVPQQRKLQFSFDEQRTARLVELFGEQIAIGKIFIEPHLKVRLKLKSKKIAFHGCHAVRHDDHIHVQLQ